MIRLCLYRNKKMKDVDFYCLRKDDWFYYGCWVTRNSELPLAQDRIAKVRFFSEDWELIDRKRQGVILE